jgi:hypothetical protein
MRCSTVGGIVTLTLSLLAVPLAASAQQPGKMPRIGWLSLVRADTPRTQYAREVIRQGLRESGWVEGRTSLLNGGLRKSGPSACLPSRPSWSVLELMCS